MDTNNDSWSGLDDKDDFLSVCASVATGAWPASATSNETSIAAIPATSPAFDAIDSTLPYLERLHTMLEECSVEIAAWTNHGTAFAIFNPAAFEEAILPRYFQSVKFASFLRQLNSYRFVKSKTTAYFEFRHNSFVRHRPDLLHSIKRQHRVRPSRAKAASPTASELRASMAALQRTVRGFKADVEETRHLLQAMLDTETQGAPPSTTTG
ncbi:Aste57867_21023 [Aphanomyces stellatus]|uniref:Aste57867_21023 protein n=1 Tax=Aphanomyces stellatus TaxID=120398 RepID=A0A485LGF9_9STRA|nr:hypothetical protein As57867_020955 [Aphanomyces stellatus]VFT97698.1 Aste57867_21023 [Aphanomyces stellatus]